MIKLTIRAAVMSSRAVSKSPFLALRILLTEACNLRCVFCHNEGQNSTTKYLALALEEFSTLLDAACSRGLKQVKLSGGEPTTHPDVTAFATAASSRGLDVALITNGTKTSTLVQMVDLGIRFSINLPTLDHRRYRRLTDGKLQDVLSNIELLKGRGATIALNTYITTKPNINSITSMMRYAARMDCAVKFLMPCQLGAASYQENVYNKACSALTESGCERMDDTPYDSTWRWAAEPQLSIRLVRPWCPIACREAHPYYRSLRFAADRTLHPCFGGDNIAVPISLDTQEEAVEGIDRALAITGGHCAGGAGVSVIRRHITGER